MYKVITGSNVVELEHKVNSEIRMKSIGGICYNGNVWSQARVKDNSFITHYYIISILIVTLSIIGWLI